MKTLTVHGRRLTVGVKAERQLLHAWKFGLCHPKTDEWMEFEAPLPADFAAWLHTPPSTDAAPPGSPPAKGAAAR